MEFPVGKRPKHFDIGDGDRISHLPDSLLCHILSFLPTKSSAQTCLLSTRWRSVWTSVPVLDLCDEPFQYLRDRRRKASAWTSSFRKFVIKVLSLRSLCVQILRLKIFNSGAVSPLFSLILDVILRTVEEIDLSAVDGTLHLPQILFSCGQLSVLKLRCSCIELDFPESVSMPNLKVFHVRCRSSFNSSAASVTRLLRCSPILEELVICSTCGVTESQNFSIVSSSLKTLELCFIKTYGYHNGDINKLVVIDAPKLEFLDMKASRFKIDLKNTPSILKASIITGEYCDQGEIQEIPSNLWTIINTEVLCLPMYMIKDPTVYELIHFSKLKTLVLRYCGHVGGLSMLPQILKKLPCLDHLILHRHDCSHTENIGEGLELEESEIHCLKYSLKIVQLENFRFHKGEMEVVQYFVQNSSVLNEIRLSRYSRCEKRQEMLFLDKLLTFPRLSNAVRIIFCD